MLNVVTKIEVYIDIALSGLGFLFFWPRTRSQ